MTRPEFTAVILAATCGSRMYPLTTSGEDDKDASSYLPKHLLPLAGRPLLHHLLEKLHLSQLKHAVLAISSHDEVTVPSLLELGAKPLEFAEKKFSNVETFELSFTKDGKKNDTSKTKSKGNMNAQAVSAIVVKVVKLPTDCSGSADALRFISSLQEEGTSAEPNPTDASGDEMNSNSQIIPDASHVMLMPADLVLYGNLCPASEGDVGKHAATTNADILASLADIHRENYHLGLIGEGPPLAMTLVLSDVGETDSNGIPLKESAKVRTCSM